MIEINILSTIGILHCRGVGVFSDRKWVYITGLIIWGVRAHIIINIWDMIKRTHLKYSFDIPTFDYSSTFTGVCINSNNQL